jgi:hypothetical protein
MANYIPLDCLSQNSNGGIRRPACDAHVMEATGETRIVLVVDDLSVARIMR